MTTLRVLRYIDGDVQSPFGGFKFAIQGLLGVRNFAVSLVRTFLGDDKKHSPRFSILCHTIILVSSTKCFTFTLVNINYK